MGKEIGPIAKPKDIRFGDNLPKTRSGKIMRRLLRGLAKGEELDAGHVHAGKSGDPGTAEGLISRVLRGGGLLAMPPPLNKGKEETMVAHKVALRVVPDRMPKTAGALGVPAVFFADFPAAVSVIGGGT